jgi:hypothetical protein
MLALKKMQQLLLVHTTLMECISILCDRLVGALLTYISEFLSTCKYGISVHFKH